MAKLTYEKKLLALKIVKAQSGIEMRVLAAQVDVPMKALADELQGCEEVSVNVGFANQSGHANLPMRAWTVDWLGGGDSDEEDEPGDPDFDEVGFPDDHPGVQSFEYDG